MTGSRRTNANEQAQDDLSILFNELVGEDPQTVTEAISRTPQEASNTTLQRPREDNRMHQTHNHQQHARAAIPPQHSHQQSPTLHQPHPRHLHPHQKSSSPTLSNNASHHHHNTAGSPFGYPSGQAYNYQQHVSSSTLQTPSISNLMVQAAPAPPLRQTSSLAQNARDQLVSCCEMLTFAVHVFRAKRDKVLQILNSPEGQSGAQLAQWRKKYEDYEQLLKRWSNSLLLLQKDTASWTALELEYAMFSVQDMTRFARDNRQTLAHAMQEHRKGQQTIRQQQSHQHAQQQMRQTVQQKQAVQPGKMHQSATVQREPQAQKIPSSLPQQQGAGTVSRDETRESVVQQAQTTATVQRHDRTTNPTTTSSFAQQDVSKATPSTAQSQNRTSRIDPQPNLSQESSDDEIIFLDPEIARRERQAALLAKMTRVKIERTSPPSPPLQQTTAAEPAQAKVTTTFASSQSLTTQTLTHTTHEQSHATPAQTHPSLRHNETPAAEPSLSPPPRTDSHDGIPLHDFSADPQEVVRTTTIVKRLPTKTIEMVMVLERIHQSGLLNEEWAQKVAHLLQLVIRAQLLPMDSDVKQVFSPQILQIMDEYEKKRAIALVERKRKRTELAKSGADGKRKKKRKRVEKSGEGKTKKKGDKRRKGGAKEKVKSK